MNNDDHPVIRAMRLNNTIRPHDLSYLLKHGRPYKGVELPPGTETWGRGKCIPAAEALARRYGWKFRVGFALPAQSMVGTDRQPLYHAWNTPDDEVAFDAVWPDPVHTDYFGLPRIHEPRVEKMLADKAAMRKHGHACDLLTGAFERDLKRALSLF